MTPAERTRKTRKKTRTRSLAITRGSLMRAARERLGKTQAEVANDLDVTQPTVHMWETDKSSPRTNIVRDVARVYGLEPEQLLPEAA